MVYEDAETVAFLDHKPLLHGHCLLVPRRHVETLGELPAELAGPLFANVQRLAGAVERGLDAAGAFVAINVKISQSVPHLHVHVVPRWKGDGLFSHKLLWKRAPYASETQKQEVREKIRRAPGGERRRTSGSSRGARRRSPQGSGCSRGPWRCLRDT